MKRKPREQTGSLYKKNGWWVFRYRQTLYLAGQLTVKHKAVQLIPVDEQHKRENSVWNDAAVKQQIDAILAPLAQLREKPELIVTLSDFVEKTYLPHIQKAKRPSTYKGYHDMWEDHIKPVVGNVLLTEVRTIHVQQWLEKIVAEHKTAEGNPLAKNSIKHMKALLSGIFRYATQLEYFSSGKANPVHAVDLKDLPTGEGNETHAYSLAEIRQMLFLLPEPARTMVATAAFSGVRRGELQGLRWEDWKNGELMVSQSYWQGNKSDPKTKASKAAIPVIAPLARMLQEHRLRLGNPISGNMFPAGNGNPLAPNNVLNRSIKPALKRCAICGEQFSEHAKQEHDFQSDNHIPQWQGWHAFRRGLATNLHDLHADDKTIQAILRHSDVAVTQACYIKTLPEQSRKAMNALELALERELLCAECAPEGTSQPLARTN